MAQAVFLNNSIDKDKENAGDHGVMPSGESD